MRIHRVVNFPFPTPPPPESLESAEKLLVSLGALKIPTSFKSLKQIKEGNRLSVLLLYSGFLLASGLNFLSQL